MVWNSRCCKCIQQMYSVIWKLFWSETFIKRLNHGHELCRSVQRRVTSHILLRNNYSEHPGLKLQRNNVILTGVSQATGWQNCDKVILPLFCLSWMVLCSCPCHTVSLWDLLQQPKSFLPLSLTRLSDLVVKSPSLYFSEVLLRLQPWTWSKPLWASHAGYHIWYHSPGSKLRHQTKQHKHQTELSGESGSLSASLPVAPCWLILLISPLSVALLPSFQLLSLPSQRSNDFIYGVKTRFRGRIKRA